MRTEDGVLFNVDGPPNALGCLIGKQGRTARSLRIILAANGQRLRSKFWMSIGDEVPRAEF